MSIRFNDYRSIDAKFNSDADCGHRIAKGDAIGYAPRSKQTQCKDCWAKWCVENSEADMMESNFTGYGY